MQATREIDWEREDRLDSQRETEQARQRAIDPPVSAIIEANARALSKRLGIPWQKLGNAIGYWVARVPQHERKDWAQTLALTLLEQAPHDAALAFTICRGDTLDWWKRYKVRQHYRLDFASEPANNADSEATIAAQRFEQLAGVVEYQRLDGNMDAASLWGHLPSAIRTVVTKRTAGQRLTGAERVALFRYLKHNSEAIAEYAR